MCEPDVSRQLGNTVAVIGSGPSGCYVAQSLRKEWPDAEISVFEALPTPYGLLRYGVAPDHQGTKGVSRQFDRLFERSNVSFIGNVVVGEDVSFEEISEAFDVVVVATGLSADRGLEVPRHQAARVLGAGSVLRELNSYPYAGESSHESLGKDVVIVGHGNVAIDVVRLLCKTSTGLNGSDISDAALEQLRPGPLRSVQIVGRSPASKAKFDTTMLRELGKLPNIELRVEGVCEEEEGALTKLLADCVDESETSRAVTGNAGGFPVTAVTFRFQAAPSAVDYVDGRTVLFVRDGRTGAEIGLEADSVITAIGFREEPTAIGDARATWSGDNVFRVGWCELGPVGTIAANRRHAQEVAKAIIGHFDRNPVSSHAPGLRAIWPQLAHKVVSFSDWRRIDEFELSTAAPDRCRRKIPNLPEMWSVLSDRED